MARVVGVVKKMLMKMKYYSWNTKIKFYKSIAASSAL